MKVNPALIEMLKKRCGRNICSATGAEYLRNDIEASTGERIGINTVKRIVGILEYEGSHREVILDIIARYLDYPSWDMLEKVLNDKISGFHSDSSILEPGRLQPKQRIEMEWEPDRTVLIENEGEGWFTVRESKNSKLLPGDRLKLSQLAAGFPFYVSEVVRNGQSLGNYTAAPDEGLKSVKLV